MKVLFWFALKLLRFCRRCIENEETNEADCWKNADMAKLIKDRPSLSRQHKFTLLKSHFRPGDNYVFPKTKQNNKMRSFQASWLKTYHWLVYSESEDGGYCKCCVLFAQLASNITTGALVDWSYLWRTGIKQRISSRTTKKRNTI